MQDLRPEGEDKEGENTCLCALHRWETEHDQKRRQAAKQLLESDPGQDTTAKLRVMSSTTKCLESTNSSISLLIRQFLIIYRHMTYNDIFSLQILMSKPKTMSSPNWKTDPLYAEFDRNAAAAAEPSPYGDDHNEWSDFNAFPRAVY